MGSRVSAFILVLLFLTPVLQADDTFGDDYLVYKEYKGKKWKEQKLRLPKLPEDKYLVRMDTSFNDLTYYIDTRSISLGKDHVGRYTVVIVSPSGVRNIFYEGIRCHDGLTKTYAFAVGKSKFQPMPGAAWKEITGAGVNKFREHLRDYYFCYEARLLSNVRVIIQRLKYPPSRSAPEDID